MSEPAVERFDWRGTQVIAGAGSLERLADEWRSFLPLPDRIAVLAGEGAMRRAGILDPLCERLAGLASVEVCEGIRGNPTPQDVDRVADFLKGTRPDAIVAIGGGSVIDAAKVANATAAADSALAVLDRPDTAVRLAETLVAIPTTAGTGSEVTPFATIWDVDAGVKRSLDTALVLPDLAVLDPESTRFMGDGLTRQTAADAFGHALESLWSRRGSALTRALAFRALHLLRVGMPAVRQSPCEIRGRAQVQEGSFLAGMAISITRTAAAHALSYALTLRYAVPHGLAVAELLPGVLRVNEPALTEAVRAGLSMVFGVDEQTIVPAVTAFMEEEGLVRGLRAFGIQEPVLDSIAAAGSVPGRMDNNLVALTPSDVRSILEEALDRG